MTGALDLDGLGRHGPAALRDAAAADRAKRIAAYVGLDGGTPALAALAERLVRPDPEDSPIPFARYRALVETPRFAAVFTAHPTFSLPLRDRHRPGRGRQRRGLPRRAGPPPDRADPGRGIPPGRRRHRSAAATRWMARPPRC